MQEPAIAGDPTSSHPELGGGYIAYSASGTATGQAVFVNYGLPADYAQLKTLGVSVKDRIAVARYGRSHRAVKVHTAQQEGARALVLYSDPADDGARQGAGVARRLLARPGHAAARQRQAELVLARRSAHAGRRRDGRRRRASTRRRRRRCRRFPSSSSARGEAPHVLAALGGPERPAAFRGGDRRRDARRPGPGGAAASSVDMDQGVRPIYDVVASLKGHADAGARRALRHASRRLDLRRRRSRHRHDRDARTGQGPRRSWPRSGWRPQRTISLAFWDAEEFGLVGSTEYAEAFKAQLQEQLVMYVNIDMYMKGRFDPGGVPSLRGVRRRRRQGRPGRQQQRLRPVAAVRVDADCRRRAAPDR